MVVLAAAVEAVEEAGAGAVEEEAEEEEAEEEEAEEAEEEEAEAEPPWACR